MYEFACQLKQRKLDKSDEDEEMLLENDESLFISHKESGSRWQLLVADLKKLNPNNLRKGEIEKISKKGINSISLNLSYLNLGFEGFAKLTRITMPFLKILEIKSNSFGPIEIHDFVRADWPHLELLDLSDNLIGDRGVKHLMLGRWKLKNLFLGGNSINDRGVSYLKNINWTHLTILNLSHNKIGAIGAEHLSRSYFPKLYFLDISSNLLQNRGVVKLAKSFWPCMRILSLGGCQGSAEIEQMVLEGIQK